MTETRQRPEKNSCEMQLGLPSTQKSWVCTLAIIAVLAGFSSACSLTPRTSVPPGFTLTATALPSSVPTATLTLTPDPTVTPSLIPTITPTNLPPYDDFSGTALDQKKWMMLLNWEHVGNAGERIKQDERLRMTVTDTTPDSLAYLQSRWGFEADFDIQIDFQMGEGWDYPENGHLDSAVLGVIIDEHTYHLTRLRGNRNEGSENSFWAWSDRYSSLPPARATDAAAGRYRLIRKGTSLDFLYDTGAGWKSAGFMNVPSSFAQVYFGNASISASLQFTTYFDNFVINAGDPIFR
ncbi:hypothetical protein EHM76_07265, partial [bacterium]